MDRVAALRQPAEPGESAPAPAKTGPERFIESMTGIPIADLKGGLKSIAEFLQSGGMQAQIIEAIQLVKGFDDRLRMQEQQLAEILAALRALPVAAALPSGNAGRSGAGNGIDGNAADAGMDGAA